MAIISPFRALRPTPASARAVAEVPYDVVNTEEARALAAGNPLSFLHVSRAEIDLPSGTNPYSDAVYTKARENFASLKATAPLVLEDSPTLYVYRLQREQHVQTGVAGCFSVAEYDADIIKKHERTRKDKEDDRTRHIIELRAQTGPVFLIHTASSAVSSIVELTTQRSQLFDFTAGDGVKHTLWPVAAADTQSLVAAFKAMPGLYIADGHHRAASAARTRQHLRGTSAAAGEWDTFLAVAFPDDQMNVLPYNRLVKDLGTHTLETFLTALGQAVSVSKGGPAAPARKGEVSMYLAGAWYTLGLGAVPAGTSAAHGLDVSRLQDLVLTPLLGIGDVRTDKRIDFVGGARGTAALESAVSSGEAAVAFSMYPVSVGDLMAISDAGGIMPPKSTWFEPKLRDGLLSHVI
ncbi:MAG: DUF1015 domain-containing protein [Acidobacteria bacterium]|nr:DUF1015 domain-containing protein [Acidobacteriota bacterium]